MVDLNNNMETVPSDSLEYIRLSAGITSAVLQYCPGGIAVEPLVYTASEKETMLAKGNAFLKQAFDEGILVYEQQS